MIIDKRLQVSANQALTGTDLVPSTDVIDLGSVGRIMAPGEPLAFVIVSKVLLAGTTPTLLISIESDDNSAFSSAAILHSYPSLAAAGFVAGTRLVMPFPWHQTERYVRLAYTMGGTSPTCTVDAWLAPQDAIAKWTALADAI